MRSMMRKLLLLALVSQIFVGAAGALLVCVGAEGTEASDQLTIECRANPTGAVFSRDVKVSLDIANMGNKKVRDVKVYRGDSVIDVVDELGQGESAAIMDETFMTNEQLSEGKIAYRLSYHVDVEGGLRAVREQYAYASLPAKKTDPKLEFTRTLSSEHVKKGSEVTVTYRVRNTGDIPLYSLKLEDELFGDVGEIETLMPGVRESFVKKVKIKNTSVSRPTITYRYEGGSEEASEQLKAVTIYLANEQLDRKLEADKTSVAPGELVTLRLSIVNRGNVTYEEIHISDASIGEIGTIPGELKPGDEYTFVKTVSLKTTTTFQFDITGRSLSGDEIVESSNMLTIAVSPVIEDIFVKIGAYARPSYLPAPGETTFVITIENYGDVDIRSAVLLEQNLGELKNLAVLAPGTTTIEYPLNVEEDGAYVFMVRLTDARDGHLTILSDPVKVNVDANGDQRIMEAPKQTEDAGLTGIVGSPRKLDPSKYYEQMLLWALLVVSVLVLLLLCAFTGRNARRRRRKKRPLNKREAPPNNTDNPEFADTKPHLPVGANKNREGSEG